ncbi:hypothetical protein [Deinococcus sp. Marseille-Q6407]|uniref:hypothetical protein n=1 Tax=Deinococcus sp. Marseille-Q6407 TaxID=2969223 RepID=UPI0021BFFDD8|nr:hypothetical protein [Deinococcus sp. Marseille-Q6407]
MDKTVSTNFADTCRRLSDKLPLVMQVEGDVLTLTSPKAGTHRICLLKPSEAHIEALMNEVERLCYARGWVVRLRSGRQGTVVGIYTPNETYAVEGPADALVPLLLCFDTALEAEDALAAADTQEPA